jgi:hypothetical protein
MSPTLAADLIVHGGCDDQREDEHEEERDHSVKTDHGYGFTDGRRPAAGIEYSSLQFAGWKNKTGSNEWQRVAQ